MQILSCLSSASFSPAKIMTIHHILSPYKHYSITHLMVEMLQDTGWTIKVLERIHLPHKKLSLTQPATTLCSFVTMMGLNKLGTAITVLTAVTLLALAIEIMYVLWQRRQRLRPRVRVEPQEASLACSSSSPSERERELELELEHQMMKCLNGPSRVLFTIKEEEREGFESENCSSAECSALKKLSERVAVEEVTVVIEGLLNEATPFSTPCGSPPYCTPQASPSRVECCYKDYNGSNG